MNVALVDPIAATPNYTAGGILRPQVPQLSPDPRALGETKLVELARSIAQRGHHPTVVFGDLFLDGQEWTLPGGVRIVPVSTVMRVPFHPGLIPATPALLDHPALQEADVIQVSEFHQPSTFFSCLAAHDRDIPVVVWQETFRHMRFPGSAYQRLYESTVGRYVRSHARKFVPRTVKAGRYLQELGVPNAGIDRWIPTGVDVDAFAPRPSRVSMADLGWPEDARILLLVARLHATKGVDLALRVLRWISRRCPEARLVVRGSGPEEHALHRLARDLGVTELVSFIPRRPREEMVDLYNLSDIVLSTSRVDLLPFSLMEASACGRPCVATDVGAIRDIVVPDETGVVLPDRSVEALGRAVLALLRDDERRQSLGANARRRMAREFALPVIADRFLQVYCDVAA